MPVVWKPLAGNVHLLTRGSHMKRISLAIMAVLLACAVSASFAQKKKEPTTRSVEGVVSNPDDSPAVGAVVQIENTKTQQIRSYITKDDGKYRFFELSPEVDYKLKADHNGASSGSKTLSSFDSRKQATINLKLNAK
jgi:Carboxypeptidase regulatory-like domain